MSIDNEHEAEVAEYIQADEILAEVPDDGDHPMDDGDDDKDDERQPADDEDIVWEDNSVQHFPNHGQSVFAVSAHPTAPIAASGGQDDLGYIWSITDGEVIAKLTGHTDSVVNIAFSSDGEMVATGGMDGKVRLWRRVGKEDWKTWEFLTDLQGPDEVTVLRWHPKGNVLLAGSNDGTAWLWQLPSGNTMQVFAGHSGSLQCGVFTPDGKRILTACSSGTLAYWDPRSTTPVFKLTSEDGRFQMDGITALGVNPSSTLAVVGGSNGTVCVVSLSKAEVIAVLKGHTEGEAIEAITFVDVANSTSGPGVVVTGAMDGKICIWDLTTMRLRSTLEQKDSVINLQSLPSPKGHLFVSGCADGGLCTWDARSGALIQEHKGHREAILGVSIGMQGSVVVSAGDDGVCLVFPL